MLQTVISLDNTQNFIKGVKRKALIQKDTAWVYVNLTQTVPYNINGGTKWEQDFYDHFVLCEQDPIKWR